MISGLDHLVIAVKDLAAGVRAYETLLGCAAAPIETRDGVNAAVLRTDNIGIELLAPHGEGGAAARLRDALADGEGLKSLVFRSDDIERAHRRAERVGLAPEAMRLAHGGGRVFGLDRSKTRGVRLFVMERRDAPPRSHSVAAAGVDHIVVRSPDGDAALALFSARLGLSLRREMEVAGRRLLLLRCGDAIVEIAEDRALPNDQLWGVSWRVANAEAEQARLRGAGLNVSDVRAGVKPGTRVFTVRNGACSVPTLMIEHSAVE